LVFDVTGTDSNGQEQKAAKDQGRRAELHNELSQEKVSEKSRSCSVRLDVVLSTLSRRRKK
jgi:hypothetical protein